MPIVINYTESGVHRVFSGHIDYVDVFQANGEIWGHPKWDKFRYMVDDLRDISSTSFNRDDAALTGKMHLPAASSNPRLRVAAISNDPKILPILEEFKPLMADAGWQYYICRTPEEAWGWATPAAIPPQADIGCGIGDPSSRANRT
ncbi:hypothetical protein [Nisaea nitritireducens]|uniref:hypothetical protein n=1 Tax=Nisaea nitritireducens TaxID=568392 RepID=UPI00186866FA|nr:hypothetical protein [Nisaea nitritireducens]